MIKHDYDENLLDHTIIIATYNRPELFRSLVNYIVRKSTTVRVLVLDSSRSDVVALNSSVVGPHKNQICYNVYDPSLDPIVKIVMGIRKVTTSTVSFCADDDLLFFDGLLEAREFLLSDASYSVAHGLYMNFTLSDENISIFNEYGGAGIEASHPGARLFQFLRHYEAVFYGVCRTIDLRTVIEESARLDGDAFQELFQSCALVIAGKTKRFPKYFYARRSGPPADPSRRKWQTFFWFSDNPAEVFSQYAIYRHALWRYYKLNVIDGEFDRDEFFRVCDISHASYFASGFSEHYHYTRLEQLWPNDGYRFHSDIFQALRSQSERGGVMGRIESLMGRLQSISERKKLSQINKTVRTLERKVFDDTGFGRRLDLHPSASWAADLPVFTTAYNELCYYLMTDV
ncbi:TIGR00180 family glycosyltransferase [Methylobacterium sp. NEAU 140]|nr:TIGR00180 family glycosyltransferase [Methylobacterium sp. NEAU 140]MDP4026011.1 TIGR00180 family glycosyltransferase [Methylobacterium sp. NEAU 140]